MKKLSFLFIVLAAIMTQSCTPKMTSLSKYATYPAIPADQEVYVLQPGEPLPENAIYIGYINFKENDKPKPANNYELMLEGCKVIARDLGANYIVLTDLQDTDGYLLKTTLYRNLKATPKEEVVSNHP